MTGGILQLVAKGYDDLYIINDPEITYFKIVYRRYTNFGMQPNILHFNDSVDFGKIARCKIKYLGDLISKTYLCINIPEIDISDEYYTTNNLNKILLKYDINYDNQTSEIIKLSHYNEIYELINNKLIELYEEYKNTKITKIKNSIKIQLENIGFYNNNTWTFPILNELFKTNFNHNKLSKEIYDIFHTGKPKVCWVNDLLYYLIESIEISIDNVVIDKHNSDILKSYGTLNNEYDKIRGTNQMIGNIDELTKYDSTKKSSKTLYLPLKFWFCNNYSQALPLVALLYSPIDIIVKFRTFEEVIVLSSYKLNKKPKLTAHILAHYVYVDEDERKRLCENKQEYLIETIQTGSDEIYDKTNIIESNILIEDEIKGNRKEYYIDYKLNFNYTTKYIFWIVKPNIINNAFNKFDWNFYINNTLKTYNPITFMKIKFNGRDREVYKSSDIYQYIYPNNYFNELEKNLYVYSFSLYPQQLQPSGTANFSKIADSSIVLYLNDILKDKLLESNYKFNMTCYAVNYNILRIFSGMGGIAFYT
jgi:hypothetical protein